MKLRSKIKDNYKNITPKYELKSTQEHLIPELIMTWKVPSTCTVGKRTCYIWTYKDLDTNPGALSLIITCLKLFDDSVFLSVKWK